MNKLWTRIITGSAFGLVMIFGIMHSEYSIVALFSLIAALSTYEFLGLFGMKMWVRAVYALLVCFCVAGMGRIGPEINTSIVSVIAVALLMISIRELFASKSGSILFKFPGSFGVLYIAFPFFALIHLIVDTADLNKYILLFFSIVWSADTFAYFSGKYLGKNKLWESISPKKTIEGLIGGLIGAIVVALIMNHFLQLRSSMVVFAIALITALFTVIGDLVESKIKRNLGVKDSGKMLPGHGGILDRFDGVLVGAPCYYLLTQYL